jgi:hypothetical protein
MERKRMVVGELAVDLAGVVSGRERTEIQIRH